jgi:hypothetical protein
MRSFTSEGCTHLAASPFCSRHLNVQADQLVFSRDNHDRARVRRVNGASHTNISCERSVSEVRESFEICTKICNWDNIKNSPDIICLFTLQAVTKLTSSPRVRTITADHIFRPNGLTSSSSAIRSCLIQEFLSIIWSHIATKQSIRYRPICSFALLWVCFFLCQVL